MKKTLLILMVTFFTVSVLYAQKPEIITSKKAGWHKIGEANVNFKADKDKFIIMGADRFKAIKVKVTDAPVHIENLEVTYENGDMEDIPIRSSLKAGAETRVINLKKKDAELKAVEFMYRTVPNAKNEKAHIELWGLK
jgi:hypothetical protein